MGQICALNFNYGGEKGDKDEETGPVAQISLNCAVHTVCAVSCEYNRIHFVSKCIHHHKRTCFLGLHHKIKLLILIFL